MLSRRGNPTVTPAAPRRKARRLRKRALLMRSLSNGKVRKRGALSQGHHQVANTVVVASELSRRECERPHIQRRLAARVSVLEPVFGVAGANAGEPGEVGHEFARAAEFVLAF